MSDDSAFSAEPVTGTVIGYRWWNLWPKGSLSPSFFSTILHGACAPWKAGENQATCLSPPFALMWKALASGDTVMVPESHQAPIQGCKCGFWAYWETPVYWQTISGGADCEDFLVRRGCVPVLGVIEGWGRVLKGSLGFRCETAKVTALLSPPVYEETLASLQPQAMIYSNVRAMYAEHPSGILQDGSLVQET